MACHHSWHWLLESHVHFRPLPPSTFPDISRQYLEKRTGQRPLTKEYEKVYIMSILLFTAQSSNTIPTIFVLSSLPHVLISHIKACKQIISFGLKTHKSAGLQRNTRIISWTLNWGEHSPNNHDDLRLWHLVIPEEIWKLCSGSGIGGTTWPEDLWLGPGPCCFLFLTEPRGGQDIRCLFQGLWKIIPLPREDCFLCHLSHLFSHGNNQIGLLLDRV